MKALSVHLDRLEKTLKAHGVPCKRHKTLEIAAAAFGYHNQNELVAAGKAGKLNPPMAEPIGEVTLPSGETVIIVRDPLANSSYAIDQAFVNQIVSEERAERFGPTPYGHLLNLSQLLDDNIAPLQASLENLGSSTTVEIPLYIAEIEHKHGTNLYIMASQEALDAEIAEYCRSSRLNDRVLRSDSNPASAPDAMNLSDRQIISEYFSDVDEEYLHTSTDTLSLPVSILRDILGSLPGRSSRSTAPSRKSQPGSEPARPPLPDTAHPKAPQLIAQVSSVWDDHPDYPSEDWQQEVQNGDTRRGYWDWVAAKLEQAEEQKGESEETTDLPPIRSWCSDEPEDYSDGLLYITNGCTEPAHGGPRLFRKLGLSWSLDNDGYFYPLTEKESAFVAEDSLELPNGYWAHTAYSCLYEGKKFACPTIEVGYGREGEPDRNTALIKVSSYAEQIEDRIRAIGGHVILEEDEPDGSSHTLQILIPFDWILKNAADFDDWKIKLARLIMPATGPRVLAEFNPQAWVRDMAMSVDPEGDTIWDVTAEIVAMGRERALELKDDDYPTDDLRFTQNAPKWIQEWSGPFYVEVSEQIEAFYEALDKKA